MRLARSSAGNPKGWDMEQIARDHYDGVYRFCARRIGVDRAADAAQETFLSAQKSISGFRGESSLNTWLIGIALNECRRIERKNRMEVCSLDVELEHPKTASESKIVDREALSQAMSRLSEEHREAVWLHEVEGLTYEEAAVVLGVPVGTVKSRLHHAFINLRKMLFPADLVVGEVQG